MKKPQVCSLTERSFIMAKTEQEKYYERQNERAREQKRED